MFFVKIVFLCSFFCLIKGKIYKFIKFLVKIFVVMRLGFILLIVKNNNILGYLVL